MTEISSLEYKFDALWEELYPDLDLDTEVRLIPGKRYKFDYACWKSFVTIECQGQIWHTGGHNTGKSLLRDYDKLNLAQLLGFQVFQLADEMIDDPWLHRIAHSIKTRLEYTDSLQQYYSDRCRELKDKSPI